MGQTGEVGMAKKDLPLPSAMDHQAQAIDRLHQSLGDLECRLIAILGLGKNKAGAIPAQSESPSLANQIEKHTRDISNAVDRVCSMIERLEL